jgi:hypothetical protein
LLAHLRAVPVIVTRILAGLLSSLILGALLGYTREEVIPVMVLTTCLMLVFSIRVRIKRD